MYLFKTAFGYNLFNCDELFADMEYMLFVLNCVVL